MEESLESISEAAFLTAELKKFSPGHQNKLYFSKAGWLENMGHFFASFCHAFCFPQPSRRCACSSEVPTSIYFCVNLLLDFWWLLQVTWIFPSLSKGSQLTLESLFAI